MYAFKHFQVYLESKPFELHTDHQALTYILNKKDLSPRLAWWALQLQAYDYTVKHVKGTKNVVPDILSRREYPYTHTPTDNKVDAFPDLGSIAITQNWSLGICLVGSAISWMQ